MAHKIGLNDTQYEPDICGVVDFCFFDDDDNDVARTKGATSEIVSNSVIVSRSSSSTSSSSSYRRRRNHTVIESSSSTQQIVVGAKCLVESRLLEDTSCGFGRLTVQEEGEEEAPSSSCSSSRNHRTSRRRLPEGHLGSGEAMRNEDRTSFVSSSGERGTIGNTGSLEAHEPELLQASSAVMDHADHPHPYSSDEWEESELSDTDDDHSDSSDDDDPKSQVDRLIERGTLIYMDGENSNLSSETESSDSSDYDDSDSESDITDVSPLISATASPLGLSPVLPRRTLGTSPLALHDNRDLIVDYRPEISSNDQGYDSQPHCNGSSHSNSDDSTDMTLLLKAVVELEKKQKRSQQNNHSHRSNNDHYNNRHYHHHHHKNRQNSRHHHQNNLHHQQLPPTSPITIHPIDASPHHSHLRKASHSNRRKNMSFSNDEVRRIDRENQILLHKIVSAHNKSKSQSSSNQNTRSVHRPANSTVNRRREEEKIRRENMILLRKIQEAKPSRDVTASRSPRHRTTHGVRPQSSLPATPGSIGASARTA